MKSSVFKGGVPTGLDVDALVVKFGVPAPGATILHEDIESVLHLGPTTSRFWSVTAAWRKRLHREHNLVLVGNRKGGFDVLRASERITHAVSRMQQGARIIRKGAEIAAATDRGDLNAEERRVADHAVQLGAQINGVMATAAKALPSLPEAKQNAVTPLHRKSA